MRKRNPLLVPVLALTIFALFDLGLCLYIGGYRYPSATAPAWIGVLFKWAVWPAAHLTLCAVALFFTIVALITVLV